MNKWKKGCTYLVERTSSTGYELKWYMYCVEVFTYSGYLVDFVSVDKKARATNYKMSDLSGFAVTKISNFYNILYL